MLILGCDVAAELLAVADALLAVPGAFATLLSRCRV